MEKQKGISSLVGTIIVIITAIIFMGAALGYSYYFLKPEPINNIIKLEKNELAEWKIYRSEEHEFEFKYPPEMKLGKYAVSYYNTDLSCEMPRSEECIIPGYDVSFGVIKGDIEYTAKQLEWKADGTTQEQKNIKEKDIVIDGHNGVVYKPRIRTWEGGIGQSVLFNMGQYTYYLDFATPNYTQFEHFERVKPIFDKILSTFKFIENQTADWKTYANKEHGFEIKYPSSATIEIIPPEQQTGTGIPIGFIAIINLPFNSSLLKEKQLVISFLSPGLGKELCFSFLGSKTLNDKTEIINVNSIELERTQYEETDNKYNLIYYNISYIVYKKMKSGLDCLVLHSGFSFNSSQILSDSEKEKEAEIFDQIISTFKFIK